MCKKVKQVPVMGAKAVHCPQCDGLVALGGANALKVDYSPPYFEGGIVAKCQQCGADVEINLLAATFDIQVKVRANGNGVSPSLTLPNAPSEWRQGNGGRHGRE